MATYIVLLQYTQQGIENVKDSPARTDAAKEAFRAMGAEVKAAYLVMGRYDVVAIVEAPNDETMARIALSHASQGNVRSETLRAFTEDEARQIIAAIP